METRRGPGEPPPTTPAAGLTQQYSLRDNLRMRYEQQKATGDPGMWSTASKLKEVDDAIKAAEASKWGPKAATSPKATSSAGGGGLNYTADELAEWKKKWGIK
jgi:hypothetical protein